MQLGAVVLLMAAGCSSATDISRVATPFSALATAEQSRVPDTAVKLASPEKAPASPQPWDVLETVSSQPAFESAPLGLDDLLILALDNNPELAAAQATARAARGRLVQAGLYPNPIVGWQTEELSLNRAGGGQQGPFVSQEFVTGGKLRLARVAAARGVRVSDWQAIGRWHAVTTRIRSAYYELLAARQAVRENEDIRREIQENAENAEKLSAQGHVLPAEVARFRVELLQSENRLQAASNREVAARRLLAAAVGVPELGPIEVEVALASRPPTYTWTAVLESVLSRHSEVQEAQTAILAKRAELALARSQGVPNVELRLRPAYDFPDQSSMLFVEAGSPIRVFNRNQGNIMAAQAHVARSVAEARAVEIQLTRRLATAMRRYDSALNQVIRFEEGILSEARTALDHSRRLFEVKGERFFDVLDAQRTLGQVRLEYIEALGELWQAVSEIEGLLQQEETEGS